MRDAIDQHTGLFYRSLRRNTLFGLCLSSLNAMMSRPVSNPRMGRPIAVTTWRATSR